MRGAAAAELDLARGLVADQRADEALHLLERALARHPRHPGLLRSLAAAHAALGRPVSRLASAEAALAAQPQAVEPALELAEALEAVGRRAEADARLARLVEAHPADPRPRSARARLAERRQRPELAEAYWRRVLALRPDEPTARLGVSRALRAQGRLDDAEGYCRTLLALHPGEAGPLMELARIALDAGEPLLAEARWRRAVMLSGRAPEAILGLAQALAAQHRFAAACALLEQLGADRPEIAAALARTLLAEGDLDRAERVLRTLVQQEPHKPEHRLALGRVLEQRWDYPAATVLYRELAQAWPETAAVRQASGELALLQGDAMLARDSFLEVLERDLEHLEARLGLADAATATDAPEEAQRWLAEAMALAPASPRVWQRRIRLAEEAGRVEEARLLLLEACSAMPQREQPRLWLIAFDLRRGEPEAARQHAAAALVAHPRSLSTGLAALDAAFAAGALDDVREVLEPLAEALPEHREVQRRLARLETLDGAAERARGRWWRLARFDPRIHGPVDRLERLDRHPLPPPGDEVRVFLVLRNERTRLPWLLDHYRGLGAARFLIVDNGSDDGTTEWLRAQGPDVHVFYTRASFGRAASGMRWMHALLDEHGSGGWALCVDGDEALVYPHCERLPLPALCAHLDEAGAEALLAPLIDMYPEGALGEAVYEPGTSLIDAFPWLDAHGYVRRDTHTFPFTSIHGGCRARLFYPAPELGPALQKVPLVRWSPAMRFLSARHTALPCRLAAATGALLHFKYTPEFAAYVRAEALRGEHYRGGQQYRVYLKRLESGAGLAFRHPGSVRYAGSRQLVELGLIRSTPELDAHALRQPLAA